MSDPRRTALVPILGAALLLILAVMAAGRVVRSRDDSASTDAEQQVVADGDRTALGSAPSTGSVSYVVGPGDTLSGIAARFGTTIEVLMAANGINDPDAVYVGQELQLAVQADRDGPPTRTVPDSEVVYGPAYLDFDVIQFLSGRPGRLSAHTELVDGAEMTGPEIVARVAREFSVGPRVLLAFVEARSGWVGGGALDGAEAGGEMAYSDYPAGLNDPMRSGLWLQLNWLADRLNGGYYDWKTRDRRLLTLADGTHLRGHESLGPGSFAVQRALALQSTEDELPARLAEFDAAYRRLFGDPWSREIETPVPGEVDFPRLQLPFSKGETWWLTGGPHGGWADGSAWSALDFVPNDEERGCYVSAAWSTAVADGVVIDSGTGQLWLDIDGDGRRETGPAVFYLHLSEDGKAQEGTRVGAGDRLGHPSCDGGVSNATHVHIARTYDGEWLAAAGPDPLVLGDWRTVGAPSSYDGGLVTADGREREACECRLEGHNDVVW
ncbi:MAG: LysM peptidoglycan-binding domain-containing protein [Anaerolineae bacterium]